MGRGLDRGQLLGQRLAVIGSLLQFARARERVPRIIWSLWNDHSALPKAVRLARSSWGVFAPEYEVRFLDMQTWRDWLPPEAAGAGASQSHALFSDWMRTQLLAAHGGVWIDSTIILTAPLDLLINETAELSGVQIDGALFEPYFLAAAPGGALVTRWRDEFSKVAAMGEEDFDRYLTGLKARGIEPLNGQYANCDWADGGGTRAAVLHGLLHAAVAFANLFVGYTRRYVHPCGERYWMHYLRVTVAFNAAIGTRGGDPRPLWDRHGVSVQDTKETLSLASVMTAWDVAGTVELLHTRRSAGLDMQRIRGVKLRSKERAAVEAWSHCEEGSLVCKVQRLAGASIFEERPEAAEL